LAISTIKLKTFTIAALIALASFKLGLAQGAPVKHMQMRMADAKNECSAADSVAAPRASVPVAEAATSASMIFVGFAILWKKGHAHVG